MGGQLADQIARWTGGGTPALKRDMPLHIEAERQGRD